MRRWVSEFLKELNLAEGRSTGIPKILKAMSENGSPASVFGTDEDYSYLLVCFSAHPYALEEIGGPALGREAHDEAHGAIGVNLSETNRGISGACGKPVRKPRIPPRQGIGCIPQSHLLSMASMPFTGPPD